MHPLVWIGMLLGGLVIWRRKDLKDDTEKVKSAAAGAKTAATEKIAAVRGGSAQEAGDEDSDASEAVAADASEAVAADASEADAAADDADGEAAEENPAE